MRYSACNKAYVVDNSEFWLHDVFWLCFPTLRFFYFPVDDSLFFRIRRLKFFFLLYLQQLECQPTNNERINEMYGLDLVSGSSRTTLQKTNGMVLNAGGVYAIACSRILSFIHKKFMHIHHDTQTIMYLVWIRQRCDLFASSYTLFAERCILFPNDICCILRTYRQTVSRV